MARPKKQLDLKKVAALKAQGLSYKKIALILKVSHDTITRRLKATQNPTQNPPTSYLVKSKKPHKQPQQLPTTSECLPNTTPPASTLKAHNAAYSLAYSGTQPVSINKFVLNSKPYYRFNYGDDAVFAYKNRILVWVNEIRGSTPQETEGRARGRARAVLAQFASEKGIKMAWDGFGGVTSPHFTVEDKELNNFLLKEPNTLREHELKPGDTSHKGQVEADTLQGRTTLQSLLMLPEDMKVIKEALSGFAEYNANIKTHLRVLRSMDRTLKEIRTYINAKGVIKNR